MSEKYRVDVSSGLPVVVRGEERTWVARAALRMNSAEKYHWWISRFGEEEWEELLCWIGTCPDEELETYLPGLAETIMKRFI